MSEVFPKIGRRRARILAFQALFAWDAAGITPETLTQFTWLRRNPPPSTQDLVFSRLLFLGTLEHLREIDGCVSSRLEHWDFVRLNKVDKAILRLSAYSLLFQKDIPPVVVIHEAVSIARDFGTDDSFRFVNGVLDNIAKSA